MADLAKLLAISAKISTDIDTKLAAAATQAAADAATIAANTTTIADLRAQLAASKDDQVGVDAVTDQLTAADAKLT